MPRSYSTDFDPSGLSISGGPIFRRLTADNATLTNVATAQALLPGASAINLSANTTYQFEGQFHLSRAAGTTSHTTGLLLGGTATYNAVDYVAQVSNPTGNILGSAQELAVVAATIAVVTAANAIATEDLRIYVFGVLAVLAAGTMIPQFQYSVAPGGAPTAKRGSFISLWPIGTGNLAALN